MLNNSDFLRMNTKRTVKKILFKKQVCQLAIKSSQYACNQFFSGLFRVVYRMIKRTRQLSILQGGFVAKTDMKTWSA